MSGQPYRLWGDNWGWECRDCGTICGGHPDCRTHANCPRNPKRPEDSHRLAEGHVCKEVAPS